MGKNELIHVLAGRSAQILDEVMYHRKQGVEKSKRLEELFFGGNMIEFHLLDIMIKENDCFISFPLKVEGKEISPEVADYCFRHYHSSGIFEVNGIRAYGHFALESASIISDFVEKIKHFRGQGILTAKGKNILEEGVIDGECQFIRENSFRNLLVPVKNKINPAPAKQTKQLNDYIFVHPDFFSLREREEVLSFGEIYDAQEIYLATNYTEARVPCGVPENLYLYAGNNLVERKKRELAGIEAEANRVHFP